MVPHGQTIEVWSTRNILGDRKKNGHHNVSHKGNDVEKVVLGAALMLLTLTKEL